MPWEVIVPIVSTVISGAFLVWVAKINKDNKPVRDLIKTTKMEGNGSLVEALGILQDEYKNSQMRHAEEIRYYVESVSSLRAEMDIIRAELKIKDEEITSLRRRLEDQDDTINT